MNEKAKEARRAYTNAWRAANRDKVREYNNRYWERKAEQMKQAAGKQDEQECNNV